jgi:L-ascorbate metabolism protein UlaG (beta-lactamase superfamily)
MPVRVTKYTHACVRIEDSGSVLVIDPGTLSEPESVDGADAVLITHEHFDHLDAGKLADALAQRPSVALYAHPAVADQLTELDGVVHRVLPGEKFTAAGFPITVFGGLHAEIHPDLPRVPNLAFHVGNADVYHPGDSFDVPEGVEVRTLFVPVSGPWLKLSEAVEFVRRIAPQRALALHDGLMNEVGGTVVTSGMRRLCHCSYDQLSAGTSV